MSITKWILPALCVTGTLSAQALGDLNGLVSSAGKYVHTGMAGTPKPMPLELVKISGDNGSPEEVLMYRSVDVQHWRFTYRIDVKDGATLDAAPEAADPAADPTEDAKAPAPKPHRSVNAECTHGVFGGFKYSPSAVLDFKTLENTWIGVPLEDAIDQLKANGYVRGFSKVTLARPTDRRVPDEYVYVFNCPWERTQVAISTQTGALAWTASY